MLVVQETKNKRKQCQLIFDHALCLLAFGGPKASNKSKNATLSGSQIDESNLPHSVDSIEKGTVRRNEPNGVDFNRASGSESDLENNFRSENSMQEGLESMKFIWSSALNTELSCGDVELS